MDGMRSRIKLLCTAAHNFSKFQTLAERGTAPLTKLLNFTSPGPEFLHGKFGVSGLPLKGIRLMRSVKRPRSTHFFTLKV